MRSPSDEAALGTFICEHCHSSLEHEVLALKVFGCAPPALDGFIQ